MQTFEYEHLMLTYEADISGRWRPDAAFRMMQEVAGGHAAHLGLGRSELLESCGCVWMIARAQFEMMHYYPKLNDTVYIKTWYGEPGRTTYPRYVVIHDHEGKQVASMATSWIVVDNDARRIMLPSKVGLKFPTPADLVPPMPEPGKIRLQQTGEAAVFTRTLQYSDLDINGHMNNTNYITWILDTFPIEHHRLNRIRSLRIAYIAEVRPGVQVRMTVFTNGLNFEVLGTENDGGHTVFEAQGEWTSV